MELEFSAEKFFNFKGSEKKVFLTFGKSPQNAFRIKRNRCQLIENYDSNCRKQEGQPISYIQSQNISSGNRAVAKNFNQANYFWSETKLGNCNDPNTLQNLSNSNAQGSQDISILKKAFCYEAVNNSKREDTNLASNPARRIEFDSVNMDKRLDFIIENFRNSNNDSREFQFSHLCTFEVNESDKENYNINNNNLHYENGLFAKDASRIKENLNQISLNTNHAACNIYSQENLNNQLNYHNSSMTVIINNNKNNYSQNLTCNNIDYSDYYSHAQGNYCSINSQHNNTSSENLVFVSKLRKL